MWPASCCKVIAFYQKEYFQALKLFSNFNLHRLPALPTVNCVRSHVAECQSVLLMKQNTLYIYV